MLASGHSNTGLMLCRPYQNEYLPEYEIDELTQNTLIFARARYAIRSGPVTCPLRS
jgi:hypothetical protein